MQYTCVHSLRKLLSNYSLLLQHLSIYCNDNQSQQSLLPLSGGGTGGATGALAPLIVKFRGLSPPKMYRVYPSSAYIRAAYS